MRDEAGAVVAVHNVAVETTGRVRAEGALAGLMAASPAVMAVYSGPEHVVTYVNPTWERLVGKPGALGRPLREVFPEMATTGLAERLAHVYANGERYAVEELPLPLQRGCARSRGRRSPAACSRPSSRTIWSRRWPTSRSRS